MPNLLIALLLAVSLLHPMMAQEKTAMERRSIVFGKLQTKLPKVTFNNISLNEAVEFLRLRATELDRSKPPTGLNFVLNHPTPNKILIKDLALPETTFTEALNAICLQTKTQFQIDEYAVVISPQIINAQQAAPGQEIIQRRWTTSANFLNFITPPAGKIQKIGVSKLLEALGVSSPEGSSASFLSASQTLIARNTKANLDIIDQIVIASLNPGKMAMDQRAVERIILGEVSFFNATLSEALMFLDLRAKHHIKIKIAGDNKKLAQATISSLNLTNIPLPTALKYICQLSGTRYIQHGNRFIILPSES